MPKWINIKYQCSTFCSVLEPKPGQHFSFFCKDHGRIKKRVICANGEAVAC